MTPRRGQGGGPVLDLGADRTSHARRLRRAVDALHLAAEREAERLLQGFERRHGACRFSPSRLARCPRDRRLREEAHSGFLDAAPAKRRPQIERLRRKLLRLMREGKP